MATITLINQVTVKIIIILHILHRNGFEPKHT
jgi:hypothetical protein